MKNFENYFKKEKWIYAGSNKEVRQNMEQVQSIESPFQFAMRLIVF